MKSFAILSLTLLISLQCLSGDLVTCESSYTENGWFHYKINLHDDPYFDQVDQYGIAISNFLGFVTTSNIPSSWAVAVTNNFIFLDYHEFDMPRPQHIDFSIKSDLTNACIGSSTLFFSGTPHDLIMSAETSFNIAGYQWVETLIPCETFTPETPKKMTRSLTPIADVKIDSFIIDEGQMTGLKFSWERDCTVMLQYSDDLILWEDSYYILGYSPSTRWVSPVPLDSLGKYFRLQLVSAQQRPELLE